MSKESFTAMMVSVKQTCVIAGVLSLIQHRVVGRGQEDNPWQRSNQNAASRSLSIESNWAGCHDIPDWHDSFGPNYDCEFYGAQGDGYCANTGDQHGNFGLTANKACCTCGGGLQSSNPITSATGWQLCVHRDVYYWAVKSIELYSSVDCDAASRVSTQNGVVFFDSGHKGNQGPDRPFNRGVRWPGRKDDNGNFYLGLEFDAPQTVRCIRLAQHGQGAPNLMIQAKETPTASWTNVHHATDLTGGWNTISLEGYAGSASTSETQSNPAPPTELPLSNSQAMSNPIEVPSHLVPSIPGANQDSPDIYCRYLDLSSVTPPPNPGYPSESIGANTILTGDDIWETSFYMMLYANCERQVRGIAAFQPWSDEIALALQPTYVYQSGHGGFGSRTEIIRTLAAEGAGGAPVIGNNIPVRRAADEDTLLNRRWDPMESARVAVAGLVNHGDALRDPEKHCVWASVTLGPRDNNWMSAVLLYGRAGCD